MLVLVPISFAFNFFSSSSSSDDLKIPGKIIPIEERGIPISDKSLYENDIFTCDNGKIKLNRSQINNNYCDCDDGTDEPGTSACSNSYFTCKNNGYRPIKIPSSRVDDGICDCCDGSDEGTITTCYDTCEQVAKKEMAGLERMRADYKVGSLKRNEYINAIKNSHQGYNSKIKVLSTNHDIEHERMTILKEALQKKNDEYDILKENFVTERKMSHEQSVFSILGLNNVQSNEIPAIVVTYVSLTDPSIADILNALDPDEMNEEEYVEPDIMDDEDEDTVDMDMEGDIGTTSDMPMEDTTKYMASVIPEDCLLASSAHLGTKHQADILEEICRNINSRTVDVTNRKLLWFLAELSGVLSGHSDDEIAKIRPMTQLHALTAFPHSVSSATKDTLLLAEGENGTCVEYLSTDQCNKHKEVPALLSDMRADSNMPVLDATLENELKRLRDEYSSSETIIKDLKNQKDEIEDKLSNFQTHSDHLEWLHLKNECFSIKGGEFTYDVCIMGQITQNDGRGSRVTLGNFNQLQRSDSSTTLKYQDGQHCWNHGARAADVTVTCGSENIITEVIEPSTCYYTFSMTSPAACTEKVGQDLGLGL